MAKSFFSASCTTCRHTHSLATETDNLSQNPTWISSLTNPIAFALFSWSRPLPARRETWQDIRLHAWKLPLQSGAHPLSRVSPIDDQSYNVLDVRARGTFEPRYELTASPLYFLSSSGASVCSCLPPFSRCSPCSTFSFVAILQCQGQLLHQLTHPGKTKRRRLLLGGGGKSK